MLTLRRIFGSGIKKELKVLPQDSDPYDRARRELVSYLQANHTYRSSARNAPNVQVNHGGWAMQYKLLN